MVSFKNSFLVALLGLVLFIVNCQADGPPKIPFMGDKKPDFDKCLVESGLTRDDLKALHDDPPKETSTKELCFGKCIAKSAGFIKDDGMINTDLLKTSVPPSVDAATVATMIKCLEDAGKVNTCDDMAKVMKCIPKTLKD